VTCRWPFMCPVSGGRRAILARVPTPTAPPELSVRFPNVYGTSVLFLIANPDMARVLV